MHIVAGAKDECGVSAGFGACVARMNVSGESAGVKADHVFCEGGGLRQHFPVRTKGKAGSVKHEAVVAADLVHHGYGHTVVSSNGGEHVTTKFSLAKSEGRSRNIQQDLAACSDEISDRIDAVEAAIPEILVVPGVFANGERARGAS